MPIRILEYENEIIRSAIDYEKIGQKNYKIPLVIPIVLYTGSKKWNANTYIGEMQENLEGYEQKEFARFKVIDINNYNKDELLKEKSINSKLILLEKAENKEILVKYLEDISEEVSNNKFYDKKQKETLITIIELVFKRKIGKEKTEEIINKLKGGEENMLAVVEMLEKDDRRIRREGIKDGIKKQTIKMIKKLKELNYPEEEIQKIMELSKEEIKNLMSSK